MEPNIKEISKIIEYSFKDENLLKTAFTHSSFANLHQENSNERLEFLGDSVLNFCTTLYLYNNFDFTEGEFSKIRAYLVSSEYVSNYILKNKLEDFLICHNLNPKNSINVMGDLYEAIVGAMMLDSNIETCKKFIYKSLEFSKEFINSVHEKTKDYKTELQELVQSKAQKLEYVLLARTGPAHNPEFKVTTKIDGQIFESATGKTKKEAENTAAQKTIEILKNK